MSPAISPERLARGSASSFKSTRALCFRVFNRVIISYALVLIAVDSKIIALCCRTAPLIKSGPSDAAIVGYASGVRSGIVPCADGRFVRQVYLF